MLPHRKHPPQQASLETAHVPAPVGGINTVDAGATMPPQDCVYAYNLLAAEYGLRTRLGWREWVTGVRGGTDSTVRTLLPFTGSAKSGAQDKLFAVSAQGIWDATASAALADPGDSPLITFPIQSGDAGYGVSHAFSTAAGRFLVYCDEENGAYLWSESGAAWAKLAVGTRQPWEASFDYEVGDRVANDGNVYECVTAGTSDASGGPTGNGSGITDGTAEWDYVEAESTTAIGPSLADQRLGYTADPADFAFVTAWKNRLWFVEKDTALGWYLDINSIYGVATSFNFGSKMRAGGPLVGLYNWSYDGGGGLDTLLVGVSGGGDVVIYQGTDPSSISTFGLKGCWSVGAIPYGRNIATDFGGDLLILSLIGVVPLSKLVVGASADDASIYKTRKVANLFNQLAAARRTLRGWALHIHPTDNALVVLVPDGLVAGRTEQLVMALATGGWTRYRDLSVVSAATWAGDFWFGDASGRVCRNTDYVDGVDLANSTSTPIDWSLLAAYRNLGNMRQKQVQLLRPILLTGDASAVVEATARYDFDLVEPDAPTGETTGGWDYEEWDEAVWGGDYVSHGEAVGAVGIGRDVAVAVRGRASSRTVLVGVDVAFTQGGVL